MPILCGGVCEDEAKIHGRRLKMGKTSINSWGYIKSMVRNYPRWKKIEGLQGVRKCERDAVEAAVAITERMPDGADRLRLIELVYWKKSYKIAGAARKIPCSERTALQWHGDFIKLVGMNFRCESLIDREQKKKRIERT